MTTFHSHFQRGVARFVAGVCVLLLLVVDFGGLILRGEAIAQAHAQEVAARKIALLVVPKSKRDASKAMDLEFLLRRTVVRLQNTVHVELSPAADPAAEQKVSADIDEALRALISRDAVQARARLTAAKAKLDATPALGNHRLWARYHKAQALSNMAINKLVDASDHMVKSLLLYPNQPDSEYVPFGNRARQLLRTVRSAVSRQKTGDLHVSGTKNAEIWLDGNYVGRVPSKLPDITAGQHRIWLKKTGMTGVREMVTVKVGEATKISRKLTRAPFGRDLAQGRAVLQANFKKQELIEDRIRELKNVLKADTMLVVQAKLQKKATTLTGYFLDAEGTFNPVATELAKDLDYLDNMAGFVAESAAVTLTTDQSNPPLDPRSVVYGNEYAKAQALKAKAGGFGGLTAGGKPLTKQWWFWGAVGGAVVVIGTVVYLVASGDDEAPPPPTGSVTINIGKTAGP